MCYTIFIAKIIKLKRRRLKSLPRQPRRKSHSNVYHCMLRGINKQDIFFEKEDYLKFQDIIRKTREIYLYQLYSYVLMPNHIHLEIKDEGQKISQIIHSIATRYANYFNKKYERKGHVFESRFRSKNVENTFYMLNLVRYIHQNPLKAGISKMEEYKWSSYFEYFKSVEVREKDKIVDTEEILEMFLPDVDQVQVKKEFMKFNEKILKFQESKELLEYEMKNKLTDEEVIYFIKEELGIENIQEIQKYNVENRNKTIRKISKMEGIGQTQMERILGISIRIIQRACKK